MSGFIYIMQAGDRFKLGYSARPERRRAQLATASATELVLRACFPGTIADEKEMHEALAPWRLKGEWFSDCDIIRGLVSSEIEPQPEVFSANAAHPLAKYAKDAGRTISSIAKQAGCSRLSLYRIISGRQNATVDLLNRISSATGGVVTASQLLPERVAA